MSKGDVEALRMALKWDRVDLLLIGKINLGNNKEKGREDGLPAALKVLMGDG